MAQINHSSQKVGLSVPEVMEATGLCRQSVYTEINAKRMRSYKVGRRRLVSPDALREWVKKLEQMESSGEGAA